MITCLGKQMSRTLQRKAKKLRDIISGMDSLVLAFSGGADSTLVAGICADSLRPDKFMAVIASSLIFPTAETKWAKTLAGDLGIKHVVIATKEMQNKRFLSNREDHCYICKKGLFSQLKRLAKRKGFAWVADGTNFDDIQEERESFRALEELHIRHPLAEAKLIKSEVSALSKELSLPTWDRLPRSCLASRLSPGIRITQEKINMVIRAESWLIKQEFSRPVVRYHHENLARLKLSSPDMSRCLEPVVRAKINRKFRELGFSMVALALEEIGI